MWQVIGKAYSLETIKTLDYFKEKAIAVDFIDLELDENAEYWHDWLKFHKIIYIPVVLHKGYFAVGFDVKAFEALQNASK